MRRFHPVDAAPNVRKVLVLLTDGDDNHLDQNIVWEHRRQACTAAKNAGIEIISVFAGDPSRGLKDELLQCASPVGEDADEDDTNSFTGSTDEELEGAFEEIGQRLRPLRLMALSGPACSILFYEEEEEATFAEWLEKQTWPGTIFVDTNP